MQYWTENSPLTELQTHSDGYRLAVFAVALWGIYNQVLTLIHLFAKTPEVLDVKRLVMFGSIFEDSGQFPIALMVPAQKPGIRAAVNPVLEESHD